MDQLNVKESGVLTRPLVGVSNWALRIQAEIESVAPYPSNVLICGPTGTGKEVIARAIHNLSIRSEKPFVPVNCAALAPTLFESQMFGHLKGAFTGASFAAHGCFRAADGGTIFLDEIGELELELQTKLLRILQENVVVPLGSHEETQIDVRVVAATNRNLAQDIADGRFRQDLFYRLAVVSLRTLPLAERIEDLNVLSQFLIAQLCRGDRMPFKPLSPEAEQRLRQHHWPGNVRELQNVLERALMLSKGSLIHAEDIIFDEQAPERGQADASPAPTGDVTPQTTLMTALAAKTGHSWPSMKDLERWHIQITLEYTDYNQAEAARILDMNRGSLRRRIKEYGLDVSASRRGRRAVVDVMTSSQKKRQG